MTRAEIETPPLVPDWLPDDTEESIVGTEWHQEAIGALATMLRDVADRRGPTCTWGVCEQIELSGLRRRHGRRYSPRPDVMVLRQPLDDGNRAAIALSEADAPLFIMEVASTTTVRNDVAGKWEVYAAVGVQEYLLFDPSGDVLGEAVRAGRLASPTAREYERWAPEEDGTWRSAALEVAFVPRQPFLLVRDRDGTMLDPPLVTARRAREMEQRQREMEQRQREMEQHLRAEQAARQALEERLRHLQQAHDDRNDTRTR